MGLFSSRRKYIEVLPEQRWENISLGDFKSTSCFTPFAYGYLWFSLLISVAVYAVDTFTAYQLIAFDRWSGQIELTQLVPFVVSKWIFSVCIILSFINLAYEHFRAQRIMRRGSVAESFLDSLTARLESIRMGKGRGWKRFLVFAELTKSKKGAEIIALFTYFSFQSWIRVILCSGPRQVINALTLYSVYNVKLSAEGNNFESSISNFFNKIRLLALEDYRQAVILSGMLFTLIIWLFALLSLLSAAFFFVFFLWFKIPREDGGLTGFCERKVNKRLKQIVHLKINKAMADDERRKRKAELKAAMKNGDDRPMTMQPSLPSIPNLSGTTLGGEDKLPEMPTLSRADTMMTLDNSRPGTPGSFELNAMGQKRPAPGRTATMNTTSSYSSRAGLLNGAAEIGTTRSESPAPSLPTPSIPNVGMGYPPSRTGTTASNRSYASNPQLNRMPSNGSMLTSGYTASPATMSTEGMPSLPAPVRSPTAPPGVGGYRGPGPNQLGARPNPGPARATYDDYPTGRASPAPSNMSYGSNPNPMSPRGMGPDGYPLRSATGPVPPRGPGPRYPGPQRNMTAPVPAPYHQSSGSNGSMRNMASPGRAYQEGQGSWDFDFGSRPPTANNQRNGPHQAQDSGDYDYFNRPSTANSQRNGPRGGYGGNNGWNQDVERGNGPRY
ncbi:pheromone-regulated membrane protein 6 [Echria macrotheca]|uniref:Pheromone-regulated membrane protein 6 n=1 Tax=Echria macrotheca TaxID=438768 RepID=A0AAJ0BJX5_9PEZI|nr:pheromone-regulated membrane protein 6 [Echria macrotheca]